MKPYQDNVSLVFSLLASGVYRSWWWANYKQPEQQAVLREQWRSVLSRYTRWEITKLFSSWVEKYGEQTPPTPAAFSEFIRPTLTASARQSLQHIKGVLSGVNGNS